MARRPTRKAARPRVMWLGPVRPNDGQPIRAGNLRYQMRIKNLFGASLIGYWPLWETAGVVAEDISGNGRNGTYTGVDLANATGPKGGVSVPYFDGVNDVANVYSAGLAGAFNPAEGSMLIWVKVANAGVWTDAATRYIFRLAQDSANNTVQILKSATNNRIVCQYIAGGVSKAVTLTASSTDWMQLGISWSKSADRVRVYLNGTQSGADLAAVGSWIGSLDASRCVIGAGLASLFQPFQGWLAGAIALNREATAAEISNVYNWS